MPEITRYTFDARVLDALCRTNGIKMAAARGLIVMPKTVYSYLTPRPHLVDELHAIDEEALDVVGVQALSADPGDDVRLITLFLERRGKERGSNQRFEATGHDGGPA